MIRPQKSAAASETPPTVPFLRVDGDHGSSRVGLREATAANLKRHSTWTAF